MVEIVRRGRKDLADCYDCGSRLRYSLSDVRREYEPPQGPYEMEGHDNYYVRCPCGSRVDVSAGITYGLARRIAEIEREREYD